MKHLLFTVTLLLAVAPFSAADKDQPDTLTPQEPNTLVAQDIVNRRILLFDGDTTFGWKIEGEVKVDKGLLILGGTKDTTAALTTHFAYGNLQFDALTDDAKDAKLTFNAYNKGPFIHVAPPGQKDWHCFHAQAESDDISIWADGSKGFGVRGTFDQPTTIAFHVPAGQKLVLRSIKFWPRHKLTSVFNGKDLTGWKAIKTERTKSQFSVTDQRELNIKDGPGDLQTEGQWDDFVLQLDILSKGKHLNSGVFFRCLPGEFWSGYEAQIRNQWQGDDRTKPVDYGTGGIYNRQPARKVVANDHEWFTMTVIAHGNHLATWVNGYPVADFTDTRPMDRSARQGTKLDKGPLSLQGHDPTTDLSFRNIHIAALPKSEEKK